MYIKTISGEKCPKGGLWKVVGGHEYITIKKGDEMPNYRGKMVMWEIKIQEISD